MILFTHNDLDAVGCEMCVRSQPFRITKVFHTDYGDFSDKVNQILSEDDTELFIADLSFSDHKSDLLRLCAKFKTVVHADHHAYAFDFFDDMPKNYRGFIDKSVCACKTCYKILRLDNKFLSNLITVIDVYDCWRTDSSMFDKSQNLNEYFKYVGYDTFLNKFSEGIPDDYGAVVNSILKKQQEQIQKLKDDGKVIRCNHGEKITFVFDHDLFNPIMIQEMKEGQNYVVGISNSIIKVRLKDCLDTKYTRKCLCENIVGKLIGHPLAFTYKFDGDIKQECNRIVDQINTTADMPF